MTITNVSFNLEIDTGNQSMVDNPPYEIGEALQDIAELLEYGNTKGVIMDTNGNRIGAWKMELEHDS